MIQWKYFAGKFKINHGDIYSPFRPVRVNLDFELDDFYAGDCLLMLDVSEPDAIIETDKGLSVISAKSSLLARQYNTNWGYQYSNQAFGVRNKTFFHLLRLEIILDQEASSVLWEQILFVAATSIFELYFLLTTNASILTCVAAGISTLLLMLIGKPIIEKTFLLEAFTVKLMSIESMPRFIFSSLQFSCMALRLFDPNIGLESFSCYSKLSSSYLFWCCLFAGISSELESF